MNGRSMKSSFNLSAWALKNQQLMVFFMLLMMAAGVMSYESLPRNEDPAFTIKTAIVSARWPGANVQDTINLLTDPIEKNFRRRLTWTTLKARHEQDSQSSMLTYGTIRLRLRYLMFGTRLGKNA